MKIHGNKIEGPNEVPIVIPRKSKEDIAFIATAVLDYSDHDKINVAPVSPVKTLPGGVQTPMLQDPKYVEDTQEWALRKTHWMVLTSLEATPGLEWESIDMDDPETWGDYQEEMKEAGLSDTEIGLIMSAVIEACGLDQTKIDLATESFLASREMELVNE